MRPYTKKERIEILKNLLYNEENNPHFNLHLLKCEDDYLNMEMAYFENIGLEITSMDTGYNLKEGHTEAIVKQEDFIELYTQYFTGELLKKCVKPANDSVLFLKQLISELEESEQ